MASKISVVDEINDAIETLKYMAEKWQEASKTNPVVYPSHYPKSDAGSIHEEILMAIQGGKGFIDNYVSIAKENLGSEE